MSVNARSKFTLDSLFLKIAHDIYIGVSLLPPPRGNRPQIFAVRKDADAFVLDLWNNKILPSLLKILDKLIGSEYSVSLVREGTSKESATAVIRIESPQVPAQETQDSILEQLNISITPTDSRIADSRIGIRFSSSGPLEL